ncbi:MAG: GIY-YIG nuclease family protein [Schwartzia succinivorans]|nr:GIY-YIG nuclease family protein [Schwartzia succinivorans]
MNKSYCVYEHIFPNGKKYIGISCDSEKRWRNGKGYETQPKIARAIKKYGWENVAHNIIIDGISKEQAETLERYLIAELKTIDHGYNTSTGGDCIVAYYLNDYTLAMLNYAKKNFEPNFIYPVSFNDGEEIGMPEIIAKGKTDKEIADFFNEATRAVTMKHRKYSATSEDDVFAYFFHMREYYLLSLAIKNGIDVSQWNEGLCTVERFSRF